MTAISARTAGILYIVATPIGHRGDLSLRAIETLQAVDAILAEDTRHSKPLLTHLGIHKPLLSLHAHNESEKSTEIVESLHGGRSFALISDAGTPLISDPGYPLVKLARSQGILVIPIPGACALIAALSAAGIPCDTFTFCGFLPAKRAARVSKLTSYHAIEHTLVFYESTHRILECFDDLITVFGGDCPMVLAKELTKTFERFVSGTCEEIKHWLLTDNVHCNGEFVVMIPPRLLTTKAHDMHAVLHVLLKSLPLKQAVKIACELTGSPKNEAYALALEIVEER